MGADTQQDAERLARALAERDQALSDLALRDRAINAIGSGITIIDLQRPGRPIVFVNQAITKRTGFSREELLGRVGLSLFYAEDREGIATIDEAMNTGKDARVEIRVQRKDGNTFWAGMVVEPVRDAQGQVTHYITVSADITAKLEADRKREELQRQLAHEMAERERMALELKLSQKLESVGRLASGIAHEINTPIQYVSDSAHFLRGAIDDFEKLLSVYYNEFHTLSHSGYATESLKRITEAEAAADLTFMREEIPRAFDRMLDGTERVTKIVRAMKEFAHPDADEQSPADINHAIDTTLMVANNEYKYLARIDTRYAELPAVKCNISELNQVFLNLIVNAAHAIDSAKRASGEGVITITTELTDGHAVVSFEDNGCGIPQEHLDKIYDPFFTTKEVGKGTGQGLAIARSIVVDRHAGTLDVLSTVGSGTRFIIRLPVDGRPLKKEVVE